MTAEREAVRASLLGYSALVKRVTEKPATTMDEAMSQITDLTVAVGLLASLTANLILSERGPGED